MAGKNNKYKPGQVRRIALSRIRVHEADCPEAISTGELREIVYNCGKKRHKKQDWYQDFPTIKVKYVPKYEKRQFVLIEGGESYFKAQLLGIDTLLCTIIGEKEEPPCDTSLWFD